MQWRNGRDIQGGGGRQNLVGISSCTLLFVLSCSRLSAKCLTGLLRRRVLLLTSPSDGGEKEAKLRAAAYRTQSTQVQHARSSSEPATLLIGCRHSVHLNKKNTLIYCPTSPDERTLFAQDDDLGAHGLPCLLDGKVALFVHIDDGDGGVHASSPHHRSDDGPGYHW